MQELSTVVAQQEQQSEVVESYVPANLEDAPTLSEADLVAAIKVEHGRAETLQKAAESAVKGSLVHAIRAGHFLSEAKRRQEHGGWLPWLQANVGISSRTAQVYIVLARSTNAQRCAFVNAKSIRDALRLLNGQRPTSDIYSCPQCGCTLTGRLQASKRAAPVTPVRVEQECKPA